MPEEHPLYEALRQRTREGPLVVAHRGDSSMFPENTLPAFESARRLGADAVEFDVRCTRDGTLVCIHDGTLDRTTDAAELLGPGALVDQCTLEEVQHLDAGSWLGAAHKGARVPTLAEAVTAMLPTMIPIIEHKAGAAEVYGETLRSVAAAEQCVLQSFEWEFVAAARRAVAEAALVLLGPTPAHQRPDRDVIRIALQLGVGMLHWSDRALSVDDVARVHDAGLLVCTYTTDDDVGFCGGAMLGFDAMCTNRPSRMLELRRAGILGVRRPPPIGRQ
jgi:glycerophosphoryl diester phosphodiesterase